MSDWKLPHPPEWLVRIVDRLAAVENQFPEPAWLSEEMPAWARHIAREIVKTFFPIAKLKAGAVWQPGEVGAILGHQLAYWHSFAENCEANCNKPEPSWDELRKVFGPNIEERATEMFLIISERLLPAFDRALKFALCLASDQDHYAASRFFVAFARALKAKPSQGNPVGRTTTTLYWVMLTSWRRVEELGSIAELHRRLCRCIYLGSHLVGDLKRVEKICERIGLSYPEIEARKSRAAIPDMSE